MAIVIATIACLFLLDFEKSYIKKSRQSLYNIEKEHMLQEATVRFLEELYTNKIDWKTINEQKSVKIDLSDPSYKLEASFELVSRGEEILPNLLDVKAHLTLIRHDERLEPENTLRLCLKKEERLNVQTPAT